jgi:hypothetical protein
MSNFASAAIFSASQATPLSNSSGVDISTLARGRYTLALYDGSKVVFREIFER